MLRHYFTLALRNLWKYRTQSIISIVGLAVGFVCFALANLWIHYEMTYDAGMADVQRTYLVYHDRPFQNDRYTNHSSALLAPTLLKTFPEVEAAAAYSFNGVWSAFAPSGRELKMPVLEADSSFLSIYPAAGHLVQGSMDFLHDHTQMALTERAAIELFGTTRVLGDSVRLSTGLSTGRNYAVGAVLRNVDEHSNLYFGCWVIPRNSTDDWAYYGSFTLVRLRPGVDVPRFVEKMKAQPNPVWYYTFEHLDIIPLSHYHRSEVNNLLQVNYHYMIFFSVIGALVIVCALLNYLMLFVMRMRTRRREVELRRVCGSSLGNLLKLFGAEYLLVLLLSGLIGMWVVELVLPAFRKISGVTGGIYGEAALYFVGVLVLAFVCLLPFVLRRHRLSRRKPGHAGNRVTIWLQLVICMSFALCVSVVMLQLHHLSQGDLGWNRHNTAVLRQYRLTPEGYEALCRSIDAMPIVTESLKGVHYALFPEFSRMVTTVNSWDGKPNETDPSLDNVKVIDWNADFDRFYGLKLIEGELLRNDGTSEAVINEAIMKALGWTTAVGKKVDVYTVVGVVKNFYTTAPTMPVEPTILRGLSAWRETPTLSDELSQNILLKFREGSWPELKQRIDSLTSLPSMGPNKYSLLRNVEEEYDKFLTSERMLLRLLGIAALTCVLIAAFGIFSLVSLSCQQRRKEIAIRKVNGARIGDILALFVREYLLMLVLAAVVAFPIGYILMKRWLQSYTDQISIGWWLYAVIFAGTAAVVALCIGWRVWQAARSNPAETIKAE
jgi:hypothetical protein